MVSQRLWLPATTRISGGAVEVSSVSVLPDATSLTLQIVMPLELRLVIVHPVMFGVFRPPEPSTRNQLPVPLAEVTTPTRLAPLGAETTLIWSPTMMLRVAPEFVIAVDVAFIPPLLELASPAGTVIVKLFGNTVATVHAPLSAAVFAPVMMMKLPAANPCELELTVAVVPATVIEVTVFAAGVAYACAVLDRLK